MQHVNKKWLDTFQYVLLLLDSIVIVTLVMCQFSILPISLETQTTWGITSAAALIAAVHLLYALVIYPQLAKRSVGLAALISAIIFGVLFTAMIEASGQTNIVYRIGFIVYAFCIGMTGILAPIIAVTIVWVLFVFLFFAVLPLSTASISYNFVLDICVTLASLAGWLSFRHWYVESEDQNQNSLTTSLKQEKFKSNLILESITDGVMVIAPVGTVQLINDSCASMLGWDRADAINLDYRSLILPVNETGEDSGADSAISLSVASGKPEQCISLIQTKSKRRMYVDIVASPIFEDIKDQNGSVIRKVTGTIAVVRDVDKQKRQEQQRSDFISTASHEMRTPVASIEGFIELALNPKVAVIDEKARGYLEKARAATTHLGQLFQDLLTVSKSDDGRLTNNPQLIEVGSLLQEITEQEKVPAERKGLKVVVDSAGSLDSKTVAPLMYVNADPERLREVIINLFDNAIKYTPSGMITVGASLKEQGVVIRVSDTGMGIAAEDIPHLFQKFYRTDNTATREIGGTGLGLYICRQIVEMLQGRIWVESTVGAGSTFYVELPRIAPDAIERMKNNQNDTAKPQEV